MSWGLGSWGVLVFAFGVWFVVFVVVLLRLPIDGGMVVGCFWVAGMPKRSPGWLACPPRAQPRLGNGGRPGAAPVSPDPPPPPGLLDTDISRHRGSPLRTHPARRTGTWQDHRPVLPLHFS